MTLKKSTRQCCREWVFNGVFGVLTHVVDFTLKASVKGVAIALKPDNNFC